MSGREGAIASEGLAAQIEDHATTALEHVDKADEWANRDGATLTLEYENLMVDRHLRLAQIHATLSVSQQINFLTGSR